MPDPTEPHNFTFGCYRAVHTPDVEPLEDDAAAADDAPEDEADPTPVTDGGPAAANTCPACENDLANVQGVPACTHCTWTAH